MSSSTNVNLTATAGISTTPGTKTIKLIAAPKISSFTFASTSIYGHQKTTGTIVLVTCPHFEEHS